MEFEILYQDNSIVVINKPSGILVHRTGISQDKVFVVQELRNQIGAYVYTVHRLDRATSGVLLFALNKEVQKALSAQFENREVHKKYHALVRGWPKKQGFIDHPVPDDRGRLREAMTNYQRLEKTEINVSIGRYNTARYTLLELHPETGRKHQIRRHLRHIAHPIIGDVNYGDRHHNHYFWEHLGIHRLMLHASALAFKHPDTGESIEIKISLPDEWKPILSHFKETLCINGLIKGNVELL
ncbi:MAG: pseudouridine synthase [bacterium]